MNNQSFKITTLSGNVVIYNKGDISRLMVLSPDGSTILRGCLGDAANDYWRTISADKVISATNWEERIDKITGAFPGLVSAFGKQLPPFDKWFILIDDGLIEDPAVGQACQDRFKFYRVTKLKTDIHEDRSRQEHLKGSFEMILVYFHVLNSGKLNTVLKIWEHGAPGTLPPKGYIEHVVAKL